MRALDRPLTETAAYGEGRDCSEAGRQGRGVHPDATADHRPDDVMTKDRRKTTYSELPDLEMKEHHAHKVPVPDSCATETD